MPSAIAHAFAAAALGAAFRWKSAPARFWIAGMACAALPDLDSIGFALGIRYGDLLGHRGLSHSFLFAALLALAVARLAFPEEWSGGKALRLFAYLFLATASHGLLDACTNGGLGAALLSPFDGTRYFFPYRPIQVSPINVRRFFEGNGLAVIRSETVWVGLPGLAFAALAEIVRRANPIASRRKTGSALLIPLLPAGFISGFIFTGAHSAHAAAGLDVFGIDKFHPTLPGSREWNSSHWAEGSARLIRYDGDPQDPTGWSDNHSSGGGDSLYVDGKGSLILKGSGPRFHLNSIRAYAANPPPAKVPPQAFVNIEATGYARRLSSGGPAWAGMEIQVRTGPLAHASAGGNVCEATGYAARFRADGKWDWEKELKHPDSKVYSTRAGISAPLFPGGTLPVGRWIGMKFLVYNVDGGSRVRLETYIDSVSDLDAGAPPGGGHWEPVGSLVDDGTNFPGGDVAGCPDLVPDMAITEGHGTVLLRTDNEACEWRFLSIREIEAGAVSAVFRTPGREPGPSGNSRFGKSDAISGWRVFDAVGRSWPGEAALADGLLLQGERRTGGFSEGKVRPGRPDPRRFRPEAASRRRSGGCTRRPLRAFQR